MTEEEARRWIAGNFGADAANRVGMFLAAVIKENERQNLISPGTIASIWTRHAVDSAQLLHLAPREWRTWLDVGTGGGFPGLIVALLAPDRSVTMCEPRAKRATFLGAMVERFDLHEAAVAAMRVNVFDQKSDVISARAVAPVEKLLRDAAHCATPNTIWLLPRGQSGVMDGGCHRSMFHVEHSVTDRDSVILVGQGHPK